jgi:hypothetical protein
MPPEVNNFLISKSKDSEKVEMSDKAFRSLVLKNNQ